MKRLMICLILGLISSIVFAQVPHIFSYQAVVRNNNGEPLAYQLTNFRISLLLGSDVGPVSYQETHQPVTNVFGLVNLAIGNGTPVSGVYDTVSWSSHSYFIKVEVDPAGGDNFTDMGTVQLLAVPYALHAEDASSSSKIIDLDGDTKVNTEENPDEDIIRFYTGGQERLRLTGNRLEMANNAGNILFGDKAGEALTTGGCNIFIGDSAGASNTEGANNTYLGTWSGTSNTTGNSNTFIGFLSGSKNTTGNYNTFVGMLSGRWNTTGYVNTYVGMFSGRYNTTGNNNAFFGYETGQENRSGERNSFLGTLAGHNNQTGSGNVYLGLATGFDNESGNDNTYLGTSAGFHSTGSQNVFIGAYTGMNETGDNKLYIANSETSEPLVYGDFAAKKLKFWADSVEASGEVRTNQRFNVNGNAGIQDTLNHITGFDFVNDKLKYRTTIYTGGIVTWLSEESGWVDAIGDPILPPRMCGEISLVGEFNGWGGDQATMPDHMMTRDVNDPFYWTTIIKLTAANDLSNPPDNIIESKFREDLNWDMNWGSDEFPIGTGYKGYGNNIPVPLNDAYDTTIYYVTFNCGTGYYTFEDLSGYCPDSITDSRDGKKYDLVLIGNHCWMAQNLNIGTRIDGTAEQTDNSTLEKYCYNDLDSSCDEWGGLYQWDEAMGYSAAEGAQGICPDGFHIPTDQELKSLEGMADSNFGVGDPEWDKTGCRGFDAGTKLKSTGGWDTGCSGTDALGFRVLGTGYRNLDGSFISAGTATFIWSSSQRPEDDGIWPRNFSCPDQICRDFDAPGHGWSIRCIKN